MRLVQYLDDEGLCAVAADVGDGHRRVADAGSTYALAWDAITAGRGLSELVAERIGPERVDLDDLERAGRLLPPLDHPGDHAHMLVTGTGLSHLGSAEGRDKMHRDLADAATLTDSMRMFKLGLEGGKPGPGQDGVQPEWFYKGDGGIVAASGQPLESPSFALDGGEEPEVVGPLSDRPRRHALAGRLGARQRVLRPRHREAELPLPRPLQAAHVRLGPELLVGELPRDIRGTSRIRREEAVVWEKPFLSGEDNMCHSIENLERHHFKYPLFRRPGDVHAHFFGTSTLSFSDGFQDPARRHVRDRGPANSAGRCAMHWRSWRCRPWRRGRCLSRRRGAPDPPSAASGRDGPRGSRSSSTVSHDSDSPAWPSRRTAAAAVLCERPRYPAGRPGEHAVPRPIQGHLPVVDVQEPAGQRAVPDPRDRRRPGRARRLGCPAPARARSIARGAGLGDAARSRDHHRSGRAPPRHRHLRPRRDPAAAAPTFRHHPDEVSAPQSATRGDVLDRRRAHPVRHRRPWSKPLPLHQQPGPVPRCSAEAGRRRPDDRGARAVLPRQVSAVERRSAGRGAGLLPPDRRLPAPRARAVRAVGRGHGDRLRPRSRADQRHNRSGRDAARAALSRGSLQLLRRGLECAVLVSRSRRAPTGPGSPAHRRSCAAALPSSR